MWYSIPMKVTRNLQITASEFFGVVFKELAEEIENATKEKVDPAAFHSGYTCTYSGKDPATKLTFKIVEYREDTFYKAVRTSASVTATITYDVVPAEAGIAVTFEYSDGSPKKKGIFGMFFEALYLGRMTDKLYAIQRSVINEKEGFTQRNSNSPFVPEIRKSK